MTHLITPDEALKQACDIELDGRAPATPSDWHRVLNSIAFNTPSGMALPVCKLMTLIYSIPVTNPELAAIAAFQEETKKELAAEAPSETPTKKVN